MNKPHLLPKSEILRKRVDFNKLFAEGRRIRGALGQIIVLPWHEKQVAFVTGKKCGTAVTRNRLRRFLREFYRTHKSSVPDNRAVVFQLFPGKEIPTYQQIQDEFKQLCKEL